MRKKLSAESILRTNDMGFYKIKVNRADKLFSDFVREKAGWRCEKCGKVCKINGVNIAQLDASHYFVRAKWNVRYDLDNVHAICNSCHRRMGEYRNDESGEYDLWMKEKLGEKRYKLLKLRANMTGRRDPELWLLHVKQLIRDHNEQRNNQSDISSNSDERGTDNPERGTEELSPDTGGHDVGGDNQTQEKGQE